MSDEQDKPLGLDELERVADAATEGPWTQGKEYGGVQKMTEVWAGNALTALAHSLSYDIGVRDATHIATFDPPTVKKLIARVRELEKVTGGDNPNWTATLCPQCGPDVKVDEDGCCLMCGCVSMGVGVEVVQFMARERDQLRTRIEDAERGMRTLAGELEAKTAQVEAWREASEATAEYMTIVNPTGAMVDVWHELRRTAADLLRRARALDATEKEGGS